MVKSVNTTTVSALERGLLILDILATSETALGVTEIARRLSVNKGTAHRLLVTLRKHGYVTQEAETSRYLLSYKLLELSDCLLKRLGLVEVANPVLKELVAQTNETAHLAVFMSNKVIYVDQEESPSIISINTGVGSTAPIHCTAIGKCLAAFLPDTKLDVLLEEYEFTRFTPRTIVSRKSLLLHLQEVRAQGYAIDDEEYTLGVRCYAVPIRDHKGQVVATVGISGPTTRVTWEKKDEMLESVTETAERISRALGFKKSSACNRLSS